MFVVHTNRKGTPVGSLQMRRFDMLTVQAVVQRLRCCTHPSA